MTEEEIKKKAEEYFNKHIAENDCYVTHSEESIFTDGFNDGYEQGQKDTFNTYDSELTDISENYSQRLKQLVKEQEQLKKENEELKNQYDVLNNFNNSQCAKLLRENEQLKETLELKKMVLKFRRHQNRRLRDKLKRMEAQDAEWHAAVESENARLKVQLNEALARIQKLEKGQ